MVTIRTDRLVLRPAVVADVAAFHEILSDARATAFWSTPPHRDIEETRAWVGAMLDIPSGEGEDFVVEVGGRLIGKAGFFRFPEIGFILHPGAWRKGYAREALRPVLARAFAVHGLEAVEADVDPRNGASLNLLGELKFEEVGRASRTLRIGDEWCHSVYLRLVREVWAKNEGTSGET